MAMRLHWLNTMPVSIARSLAGTRCRASPETVGPETVRGTILVVDEAG
jgi:hypothetical protein